VTNGAETYSRDLVLHQIPNWERLLSERDVVSTCPRFTSVARPRRKYRLAVQYLHTFPHAGALRYVRKIDRVMQVRATSLIFVSAYEAYARQIAGHGMRAAFVPMAIDVDRVTGFRADAIYGFERILWFGNLYAAKGHTFEAVRAACERRGICLDVLTKNHLNGHFVPPEKTLSVVARYSATIAVGRCALEAYALGLRVLIAGNGVGGIVLTPKDVQRQRLTNFNARYFTFSNNIDECLEALPDSLTNLRFDIKETNHAEIALQGK